jgi:cytochrome c5
MNRDSFLRYATAAALLGLALAGAAQTQPSQPEQKTQQAAKPQSTATHSNNQKASEGQTIFEQNCTRCHNQPEGFSPRISGTIVRHMRVRASLSAHDEQELLRFFNP